MKKFLSLFLTLLFINQAALSAILPARNSNCKYDANFFTAQLKETITFDGKTYLIHQRFGNYYVNGELVGILLNKSYKNGIPNINDRPINQFASSQANNSLIKNSATALFLQAFTKFSMQDYEGASEDAKKVLALDANHRKAILLLTIADEVLNKKLSVANAQLVTENSFDKIVRAAERF